MTFSHRLPMLAFALLAACGGRPDPGPPPVDEPSVLDDYVDITEKLAVIAEAHPDDRVATGQAMTTFYEAHKEKHDSVVARMRELYLKDLGRDEGERMPDRWPKKIARMQEVAERFGAFIQGPPFILRDEAARKVVIALAMSEDYAAVIEERWEEFGAAE